MAYQFTQTGAEIHDILDQVGTNTGDIAQNTQDIGTLNTSLSNFTTQFSASPTAPTAYSSRCTGISDGYIRVGNVVYVSVRFELSSATSGATVVLQGMPYPLGTRGLTAINASTNATLFAYVNGSGQIGIGTASSGNSIVVSGVYFARS